jgi:chloramphenicol-sensitive protein RarD
MIVLTRPPMSWLYVSEFLSGPDPAILCDTVPTLTHNQNDKNATTGVVLAILAYGWWAVVTPLYFWVLKDINAFELVAWRVLLGLPMLILLLLCIGRLNEFIDALTTPRVLGLLVLTAGFISVNWFVFIWAVVTDRLSEASLGYYINPIVSVILGMVFLGERLRKFQWIAVALAVTGVAVLAIRVGGVPWISLALAGSFGLYGLTRKQVKCEAAAGLTVEMLVVFPFMLVGVLIVHSRDGSAVTTENWWMALLILFSGIITIVPLVCFAGAARRLRLSTVGLLQYIAPTGQLILAVLVFNEPFGADRIAAFALIWLAVICYSTDSLRAHSTAPVMSDQ